MRFAYFAYGHHPCLSLCVWVSVCVCMCVSVCVCVCMCALPFAVDVCCQVALILNKITYMDSYISSGTAQVPFFLTLTIVFKVNILAFFLYYKCLGKTDQILLLPLDWKSCIYHRVAPLRMQYIMIVTYIFEVTNFEMTVYQYINGSRK